jgi:hypothetical protein
MKQYYRVILTSEFVSMERKKIAVNSVKELKEFVKQEIHELMRDYFSKHRIREAVELYNREPHRYIDLFSKIKYVYKQVRKSNMYRDTEISVSNAGGAVVVGKTFSMEYRNEHKEIEQLFTLWCERIPIRDMIHFAGFEELEQ